MTTETTPPAQAAEPTPVAATPAPVVATPEVQAAPASSTPPSMAEIIAAAIKAPNAANDAIWGEQAVQTGLVVKVVDGQPVETAAPAAAEPVIPAAAEPVAADVKTEVPAGVTPPVEVKTEAVPATPAEPIAEPAPAAEVPTLTSERIRTSQFSAHEKAAIALQKESGKSLVEALEATRSLFPEAQAPEEAPNPRAEIEARVTEIEGQLSQAGEEQSLMTPELAKATAELPKLHRKLAELSAQEAADKAAKGLETRQTVQAQTAKRGEVLAQVRTEYPTLKDPASILSLAVTAKLAEMNAEIARDHDGELAQAYLGKIGGQNVNSPKIVTDEVVAELVPKLAKEFNVPLESMRAIITGKQAEAAPATPPPATPPVQDGPKSVPRTVLVTGTGKAVPEAPVVPALTPAQILSLAINARGAQPQIEAALYGANGDDRFSF